MIWFLRISLIGISILFLADLTNAFSSSSTLQYEKILHRVSDAGKLWGVKNTTTNPANDTLLDHGNNTFFPNLRTNKYEKCLEVLNNFSVGVADFAWCAVAHARPVRVCEKCYDFYANVQLYFKSIFKVKDEDKYCNEILLNADKLQIVPTLYSQIQDLWNKANCDACFNITGTSDVKTYVLLDNVKKLDSQVYQVLECIHNVTNESVLPFYEVTGDVQNISVCEICNDTYHTMNEFYISMVKDGDMDSICMDVIDIVNSTRSMWSRQFKCVQQRGNVAALIVTMCFVGLTPIIFYIAMRLASPQQQIKLVPQKRLAWFQGSSRITVPGSQ